MAEVRLNGVSKAFGSTVALEDVTMTVENGAFVVLLGPTGAGKTTTLRLISGLETLDKGDILIGGRSVQGLTPAQRDVAMVFQQYSLYPHMSVRDNLAFPLRSPILRTPEDEIARKVREVAEVLHIPHKLDNKATELSGGEMQRVAIGRALAARPALLLADEPTGNLDEANSDTVLSLMLELVRDSGAALFLVTHSRQVAGRLSRHLHLSAGQVR